MKIKTSLFSLLLSVFSLLSGHGMAFAGWGENVCEYPGGHMMGQEYMEWFMALFWGLVLIALILLIRWIVQLPWGKEVVKRTDKQPSDILKEQLARGEIEIDEYREKQQLLS